jgi:hypothetical protein
LAAQYQRFSGESGVAAMNIRPGDLDAAVPSIGPDSFRNALRELSGGAWRRVAWS